MRRRTLSDEPSSSAPFREPSARFPQTVRPSPAPVAAPASVRARWSAALAGPVQAALPQARSVRPAWVREAVQAWQTRQQPDARARGAQWRRAARGVGWIEEERAAA